MISMCKINLTTSKWSTPPVTNDFTFYLYMEGWMTSLFTQRNKTNWLLDWVRPNFKSVPSLPNGMNNISPDEMLATALLMTSSTPSHEEMAPFLCANGIPSITLLGSQGDWKSLLDKIRPMQEGKFGAEPVLYALHLRPILSRFVATFEKPNDKLIRLFWNDMVTATPRQKRCDTTRLVTGWINVFHMWDGAGNLIPLAPRTAAETTAEAVILDSVECPWRHIGDLPTAYSKIPVCVASDHPPDKDGEVLMGMMAKSIKKGIPDGYEAAMREAHFALPSSVVESDHSILQALPVWIGHGNRMPGVCCDPQNASCKL
ncbi:hypothetical protein EJ08DRAFT_23167 [Tothia fuscella]|uniref:Uncharacterized protein n=1 Tax=Tothia fuscella TaxID=1048955 RepID=A0A9P4NZG7_9PEZI|nr:hypothetical protein EJ08DRAFT_23167 [Tothia fuscella]